MDDVDRAILQRLVADGRMPLQTIADQVGLRRSSVHERVRKLEQQGLIQGYRAILDPTLAGAPIVAYVFIEASLATEGKKDCMTTCSTISDRLRQFPEVLECHTLAGSEDLIAKLRVPDLASMERLVLREISGLPGVRRVHTRIALRDHFERALTIPKPQAPKNG